MMREARPMISRGLPIAAAAVICAALSATFGSAGESYPGRNHGLPRNDKAGQAIMPGGGRIADIVQQSDTGTGSPHIRWVDDEARAVIAAILDKVATEADMANVAGTEGYKRLKERELGMKRPFTDSEFASYLRSPQATAQEFQATLDAWSRIDYYASGKRAAAYLPPKAKLDASVYPLIKPRANSFVWDVTTKPAIMLYLDPSKTPDEIAMTVTHELHHIGYASCCPNEAFNHWVGKQSKARQETWKWVGAFGEGYAVLAASTDPKNPVGPSSQEVRNAWDDGMNHLDRDFDLIGKFIEDACSGRLKGTKVQEQAMKFYSIQGPWYTVGYVVASTIESAFGRKKLLVCYSDPRQLFAAYNRAVAKLNKPLPVWKAEVLKALAAPR